MGKMPKRPDGSLRHISDLHLSFAPKDLCSQTLDPTIYNIDGVECKIQKPMNGRKGLIGTTAWIGYLDRIVSFGKGMKSSDITVITGDLSHDMSKNKVEYSLKWIDRNIPGIKVACEGNHDRETDFGAVRAAGYLTSTYLIDIGGIQAVGSYMFGCWSNHIKPGETESDGAQKTFSNHREDILLFAMGLKKVADKNKKVPVMLSHYPVPLDIAHEIGKMGIKAYLSGHVHVASNESPSGESWKWYDHTANETDDRTIDGCFFSTGTVDVLRLKWNKVMKEIYLPLIKPGQQWLPPPGKNKPANMLILAGLPGAGKSTHSKQMAQFGYVVINQDLLGSMNKCIEEAAKAMAAGKSVIIDRTNLNQRQRAYWIDLANKYKVRQITCHWLTTDMETCIKRVVERRGHPTCDYMPSDRKQKMVEYFARDFVNPDIAEGFHQIIQIPSKPEDT